VGQGALFPTEQDSRNRLLIPVGHP